MKKEIQPHGAFCKGGQKEGYGHYVHKEGMSFAPTSNAVSSVPEGAENAKR